jgi:hypothetical protein
MRIGEIIETTSVAFVAESLELNRPPALGSLVTVHLSDQPNTLIFAVVTHGQTVGLDPSRHALRRSTEAVFDEAVYRQNPELDHVLRTEFGAALVGLSVDGVIRQRLPPQPPPLHYSVHSASVEEVNLFTTRLAYFRLLLLSMGPVPSQQVLAAHVREVYSQKGNDLEWLNAAGREVAILLRDDHEALMTALYAIEPGVPQ